MTRRDEVRTDGFTGERTGPDRVLFVVVLMLVAIGIVAVFSASAFRAAEVYRDAAFFLERHLIRVAFALVGCALAYRSDYRYLTRHSRPLLLLGIALLVAVLLVGWEDDVRGGRRWIRLGPINLQPSEVAKLLVVVYLADFLSRKQEHLASFRRIAVPVVIVLSLVAVLIALQRNLSGVFHVALLATVLLFLGGAKIRHLFVLGLLFSVVAGASVARNPYQRGRIEAFLNGRQDLQVADYQVDQSLIALGSGGWTGVGVGQSKQKFFFLPDSHTDFVLGIVGEELGFVGAGGVMVLFLLFGWRGARIAVRAPDTAGRLLAAGITLLVFLYAMLNIAVVTGAAPTTGVPLPFVSYGGSSLLVTLVGSGILLNISRHAYRRSWATAETAKRRLGNGER
ncbi:MAG: putative lipid II flippase FtsW [Candidatus Eisenbacteria bacterium]|nr:putative lipid II flippase FtsW [Candidatus Eisenbacteria bacterium]